MANSKTLKDRLTGERVYPVTTTRSVFNAEGLDVDTLLEKLSDDVTRRLLGYATTEALAAKADSFGTDSSLTLADGILGISQARKDEVSAAIEAAAKQLFVDEWLRWGIIYNAGLYKSVSGYDADADTFSLNGITGIGWDEARAIMAYAPYTRFALPNHVENRWSFGRCSYASVRTVFPVSYLNSGGGTGSAKFMFADWVSLQVVEVAHSNFVDRIRMFEFCKKLRRVSGLGCNSNSTSANNGMFKGCAALEEAYLYGLNTDLSFADSPLLTLDSLSYIVSRRNGTNAIAITMHPDAFARLTDELVEAAQAKNIAFVTP